MPYIYTSRCLPQFGPTFPEEFIAFAVNEKMCYDVCVVAICTFTIWFYLYIFEQFIARKSSVYNLCRLHMKSILKIVFQMLLSLDLKFVSLFCHAVMMLTVNWFGDFNITKQFLQL